MTIGTDLDKALAQAAATDKANNTATNARIDALAAKVAVLDARIAKLETPIVPPVVVPPVIVPGTFEFIRNKSVMAPAYGTLPAYGEARTEPNTGATIKRVAKGLAVYSRYPLDSADGRFLFVHGENSTSAYLWDRIAGVKVRDLVDDQGKGIGEVNELRWDYTKPTVFRFRKGMQFWQQDAITSVCTLIRDFAPAFPGAEFIYNRVEGDSSQDSRYWAFIAGKTDGSGPYYTVAIFTYDVQTNTVLGSIKPSQLLKGNDVAAGRMLEANMVEIAPDGSGVLIHFPRCWVSDTDSFNANLIGTMQDGPHLFPLNLQITAGRKMAVDETHSAWARDAAGKWHFVAQNNRADRLEATPVDGEWKADGSGSIILALHGDLDWTNFHFAGNANVKGYVVLSTYDSSSAGWSQNQIIALPLVPYGVPLRITPTYNVWPGNEGYRNEASASLSHDGLTVFWTGNWGDGNRVRDIYSVTLPANWWAK